MFKGYTKEQITSLIEKALETVHNSQKNGEKPNSNISLAVASSKDIQNVIEPTIFMLALDPVRGLLAFASTMFELGAIAGAADKSQSEIDSEVEKLLQMSAKN